MTELKSNKAIKIMKEEREVIFLFLYSIAINS